MRRPNAAPILVALALAAAAGACRGADPVPEAEPPIGVSVQPVRRSTLRATATASGLVVPSLAGEWTIYAPAPSNIARLPVKEQDTVSTGDVLVEFEIAAVVEAIARRQAAVDEAATRADRARSEFTRLSDLFGRGIASRNAYEAARAEETTAASILAQATAELAAMKAEQARGTIRARFAGVVTKVNHTEGEFVSGSPTDPILQVIDPTRLQVAAQFPVQQLARIVQGQSATILAIGGDGPLAASVASKPLAIDASAPTGEVRLAFADPPALALDTPASVEILLDQRADALVVPAAAVLRDDLSPFVMIVGDDRRAYRRDVRTGLVTDALAEILSGVDEGARVIVGGARDVTDGSLIVFRE